MAARRRNRSFSIAVPSSIKLLDEIINRRNNIETSKQQKERKRSSSLKNLVEEDTPVALEEHNLAWNKFQEDNISMLRQLTPPELESSLANTLNLEDYKLSLTDAAKLDYFVGGFLFCSEQNFGFFQTSSFMGALDKLLNNCQSDMTLEDNIAEFVTYIKEMNNLEQNVSSGIEGFNTAQSKKVIDFVHQGIFQHYNLYQYLFQNEQKVDTLDKMLEIEVVPFGNIPFPPPLHEGIPLELYEKYIAPPRIISDETARSEDMDGTETSGAMEKETSERPKSEKVNTAELILKSLKPEEIKNIVAKITEETLQNVKMETGSKIKEKEAAIVSKLNKIHLT